ncbi:hypothetical protein DMH18_26585 [Streptomyces sp. WAC 06783]|nr:hypothetical protein DMH18_26585 [Streptomyces sp. WAC 06783]
MSHARPHPRPTNLAEASAWATVLTRFGLLYTAIALPNGQWLVQYHRNAPVRVLDGPHAVLELAAEAQRARVQEMPTRDEPE